jgi:hypothetical protein
LARFRTTAPPILFVAVKPIRISASPSWRSLAWAETAPWAQVLPLAAARKSGLFFSRSMAGTMARRKYSGGQALAALGAPAADHPAAVLGGHARTKAVTALAHEP